MDVILSQMKNLSKTFKSRGPMTELIFQMIFYSETMVTHRATKEHPLAFARPAWGFPLHASTIKKKTIRFFFKLFELWVFVACFERPDVAWKLWR